MPKTNPQTQETYKEFALALVSKDLSREEKVLLQQEIADRAKCDLRFFFAVVAGTRCMTPLDGLHGWLCRFLDSQFVTRKGVCCPRGHLKSTIAAVNASAQDVARDPAERILIVSGSQPLSRSLLRDINGIVSHVCSGICTQTLCQIRGCRTRTGEAVLAIDGIAHCRR